MHLGVTGHPNGLSLVGQLGPSAAALPSQATHRVSKRAQGLSPGVAWVSSMEVWKAGLGTAQMHFVPDLAAPMLGDLRSHHPSEPQGCRSRRWCL